MSATFCKKKKKNQPLLFFVISHTLQEIGIRAKPLQGVYQTHKYCMRSDSAGIYIEQVLVV